MKILFDENIPWPLHRELSGHEVSSVQREGWSGIKNGDLLERAEGTFDILLLADKNLRYQQNLKGRSLMILEVPTNRWPVLQTLVPRIQTAIEQATPGLYQILTEDS